MRNPLLFSSDLLVKRAFNIPAYTPKATQVPSLNPQQIEQMMSNIQSYPEEQQQAILDNINKNYGQASYNGGLVGKALGNLGNWAGSAWNGLQQAGNWASQGLFGSKPFDAQDSDRYRAEQVLMTAAKNPALYDTVMQGLQKGNFIPNTATAPAAPAATAPAAPRKEGLIDGIPASQWIAKNKARQQQEAGQYRASNPISAKPSGMIYDSVSGQMVPQGWNRYNPGAASQARPQPDQKAVAAPAPTPKPETNYDPNYHPKLKGIETFKPSPAQIRRGMSE